MTTCLVRDDPSLEKSTRLLEMSVVPNLTIDQFTSDAFRVNLSLRNIKWNMLYYMSYLIFCFHACKCNAIVYLEAIENPVESKTYFELSEKQMEDQKTEGICL